MDEKVRASIEKARRLITTADHMTYITYPMVKENRLLVKILENVHESFMNVVKAILHYEYMNKRIRLYSDAKMNFGVFSNDCAARYGISGDDLDKIRHVFDLMDKHHSSAVEFIRKDRFVMMSDDLGVDTITYESLKTYIRVAKNVVKKAEDALGIPWNFYTS